MTKDQQIKEIRAKCVEANPDLNHKYRSCSECKSELLFQGGRVLRIPPIRLADILLALNKFTKPPEMYSVLASGTLLSRESKEITAQVLNSRFLSTGASWNLFKDSLDEQAPETIDFIHKLLADK